MSAVQFLERKTVIRGFGLALILAPAFNAVALIYLQKQQNPLLFKQIPWYKLVTHGSPISYILAVCSVIIGFIMLRGSHKAWKYVLALLGVHIGLQLMNLGQNIRQNWLWGAFFVVNASIFVFIADQLVFKLKLPQPKPLEPLAKTTDSSAKIPEPAAPIVKTILPTAEIISEKPIKKLARVPIGFKNWGVWAELVEVNAQTIRVRRISAPPADISQRTIEFSFKKGTVLKARYTSHLGSEYFFEFINVSADQSTALNQWIDKNAG